MTEQATMHEMIFCGTRTGKKVHKAYPSSSVTFCGHWLRVAAETYRIDIAEGDLGSATRVLCEHCFSPGERLVASKPADPREMTIRQLLDSDLTEQPTLDGQSARHRAAYLFRTMSVADRFSYLSVAMKPRMTKVYRKVMEEQ